MSCPFLSRLRDQWGRENGKVLRARSRNTCRETFAGLAGVFAHMNSQWLWLHAQDLRNIKPAQNPSTDEGGAHEVPSQAEGLLAIDDCWVETDCLQGCGPRKATHAPVGSPRPEHMQMTSSKFNGFKSKRMKLERESSWGIGKELEGKDSKVDLTKIHYPHVWIGKYKTVESVCKYEPRFWVFSQLKYILHTTYWILPVLSMTKNYVSYHHSVNGVNSKSIFKSKNKVHFNIIIFLKQHMSNEVIYLLIYYWVQTSFCNIMTFFLRIIFCVFRIVFFGVLCLELSIAGALRKLQVLLFFVSLCCKYFPRRLFQLKLFSVHTSLI